MRTVKAAEIRKNEILDAAAACRGRARYRFLIVLAGVLLCVTAAILFGMKSIRALEREGAQAAREELQKAESP